MRKALPVLLVAMGASLSAAPRLGVSAAVLNTVTVTPGANGQAQTVEAFNLGDGSLNLTATASATWLVPAVGAQRPCTSRAGNCLPITIALNTASLAAGNYTEYVTLSDPNAVDSPQEIAVTVNVAGVPASINAYVAPFGSPGSSTVIPVYTTGTGVQAVVSTQSGGNWLQFFSGTGGIANLGAPWLVQVSALSGLAPGTYTGSVVLSGSSVPADNKTITVTLNVTPSPIIQTSGIAQVRLTASSGGAAQSAFVQLTNSGAGILQVSGAASSGSFLTAAVSGAQGILLTVNPANLAPGVYRSTVTVQSNAANSSAVSIPVELLVTPAGQPYGFTGGVVNIATGALEAVAPGDIVSIYGEGFAPSGTSAVNQGLPPLATILGGAQVLVNGAPAPLYFVSPGQINFQVPYAVTADTTASVQVVSNGVNGNLRPMQIAAAAPRVLTFNAFVAGNYGIIVNFADGSLPLPSGTTVGTFKSHPAKPGDTIVVYAIGFGQTTPSATSGAAAVGLQTTGTATVSFGGGFSGTLVKTTAAYAGLTPTAVGLYQVNVTLPDDIPAGNAVPLIVNVAGQQSNIVYLAVSR